MPKVRLRDRVAQECKKKSLSILRRNHGLNITNLLHLLQSKIKINKANLQTVLNTLLEENMIRVSKDGNKELFFAVDTSDRMSEEEDVDCSHVTSRNDIMSYRKQIIDVLGCLEHLRKINNVMSDNEPRKIPHWISMAVCQTVLHIRMPRNLKLDEWESLINELCVEGVIEISVRKTHIRKSSNFLNPIDLPDDFSAPGRREKEDPYETYLRRLINRLDEHLQRERVLLYDIGFIWKVIQKHFTSDFNAAAFYAYLPDEWKIDKRRSMTCYINILLFELLRTGRIERNEFTNMFHRTCESGGNLSRIERYMPKHSTS